MICLLTIVMGFFFFVTLFYVRMQKLSHIIRIISIQVSARPLTYSATGATLSKSARKT